MAKLMRAVAWRRLERPYTRKSKYRKKAFVRAVPNNKIVKYVMGNQKKEYSYVLSLRSKSDIQLRHNALESARKTTNKLLEEKAPLNYKLRIKVYPHHVLRNNPLAAGAGADRMSTGMAHSFGKAVGLAARVRKGQAVLEVEVNKDKLSVAKDALNRARKKFPCDFSISVDQKIISA
ncbi:50S ribosomal protein L16 [Candidatus Woesearchaeota archaeon]|nr:50S ribosomal protein L16 [Candidatus Woesearchaeota archaeon]